jgi:Na+-driven multidrug efflux pump
MQTHNHQWLIQAPASKVLLHMTSPMMVAIFLLFSYDVLESHLLSTISLEALTALGFTVPLTTAMAAYAIAVTIATNALVTKALSQSKANAAKVIVNLIVLTVILSISFAALGYLLNDYIFRFLGIDYAMLPDSYHLGPRPKLMPLIESYMQWRYIGWVFLVLIWQINSLLRAVGLVTNASALFICWMTSKILLTLFLFNFTVLSQHAALETAALVHLVADAIFAVISIWLLLKKLNIKAYGQISIEPLNTFKTMSIVGLPATLQQLLTPLSITLLTVMVVSYGQIYVAVLGIVFRLEVLLLLLPMVLTTSLPSIIGVNWWSGHRDRVRWFLFNSKIAVALCQLLIAIALLIWAEHIAAIFSQDQHIQHSIQLYLTIVPIGFVGAGITIICQSSFNATGHFIKASILSLSHRIVLKLSCGYIGIINHGIEGLFIGILCAHLLSAGLALIFNRQIYKA